MANTAFHAIAGVPGFVVTVGDRGRILHWTGDSYVPQEQESPTLLNLADVWVESPSSAWVVGDGGTVLHWDGKLWLPVALASSKRELHTVWGCPQDGLWIGGRRCLIQYHPTTGGGATLTHTDFTVISIWGTGPEDIFYLCSGRMLLHWNGISCQLMELPGEEDDEYYAIGGSAPDEDLWIAGVSGLLLRGDGEGWHQVDSGSKETLSGVCVNGPEDLWVTANSGQLRHWNGKAWRTEAFSAFGWLGDLCIVDGVVWAVGEGGVVLQHRPDDDGAKE